ncbi:putative protein TPRXL [Tachysurus ichikawai]
MMKVVLLCLFGSFTALPVPQWEETQSGSGDFIVTTAADSVSEVCCPKPHYSECLWPFYAHGRQCSVEYLIHS